MGLTDDRDEVPRRYASRRRTPVGWLIKDYVDYLPVGGESVAPPEEAMTASDLAATAQHGGAFDWLAGEPDLSSPADGETGCG